MRVHPGIVLDFDHSTAEIGGVTFPACMVELPMCDREEYKHIACMTCEKRDGCFSGGAELTWDLSWSRGCSFYVPLENGLLMNVDIDESPRGTIRPLNDTAAPQAIELRTIQLCAHVPWVHRDPADIASWLLGYNGRPSDHWIWQDVDPEWAAMHLQRWSRRPVTDFSKADYQPAKLVPISHPSVRPKEA